MTQLLSWLDEVSRADIDAMLRDPLRALIVRDEPADDAILTIRNGDDDVPWQSEVPPLDDEWWDSVGWW